MIEKIKETAAYIAAKVQVMPKTAIILGTGLGELVDHITDKTEIPYTEIPNFPVSTVEGHQGKLIFGKLGKKDVMAMQGRFHYYEGYDMKQVTFPVRVMKELGIEHLFVSNAAGGMNPDFAIGDIMIIRDHINLFPEHPLHGRNYKELGVRFPDMSEAYSRRLIAKALEIAEKNHIKVQQGVYVGTQGPTFETPAEYRYFHIIGGDAVGMSRNTVCKYVRSLEEKGLIRTERPSIVLRNGRKRNGSLLYTLLPWRHAVEQFHQRQLAMAEAAAERQQVQQQLAEQENSMHGGEAV